MTASTSRRPVFGGNWKMNLDLAGAKALAEGLAASMPSGESAQVIAIPASPFLVPVAEALQGSAVELGAQDLSTQEKGAFTGAVSATMLTSVGCGWVLAGHSERRAVFGDTDEIVGAKLRRALDSGLSVILCVGETIEQRRAGETLDVVMRHLGALEGVSEAETQRLVIAYEPVWAIGTGEVATPEQAQQVHAAIRESLASRFSPSIADGWRIQYGGSVKPGNVDGLMAQPDIDGALVGGASLDAEGFTRIVRFQSA